VLTLNQKMSASIALESMILINQEKVEVLFLLIRCHGSGNVTLESFIVLIAL
jgi:hypothetical protein